MAKYQGAVYQGAYYGNNPRVVLSAEPMDAVAQDYGVIKITWQNPTGSFTKARLVRNNNNYPEGEEDGVILWEQVSSTSLSGSLSRTLFTDGVDNYADTNPDNDLPITQGQFIYYTLFIYTSSNIWQPAGFADCLMPENLGSADTLFDYLPKVYTSLEQSPTGIANKDSFLYSFLQPFAFTFDQILTYANLVAPSYGKTKLPPQFIGIYQDHLGMQPEHGLPYNNQKKLIRNGVYLYKTKGTYNGIMGYLESMTGYTPTVNLSPNLLLDTQDSSFTKSIGRWYGFAGTLSSVTTKSASSLSTNAIDTTYSGKWITSTIPVSKKARTSNIATITTSIPHGVEVGDAVTIAGVDSSFNGSAITVLTVPTSTSFTFADTDVNVVEVTATGTVSGQSCINLGRTNPILNATPVTAGVSYKMSFYSQSDANGSLEAVLYWYDYLGNPTGTPVTGTTLGTTGSYQRYLITATAPSTAVYAGIRIRFISAGTYYTDLVQIAPATTATNYDEARGLDIFLTPSKVNILANPSFETNVTQWTTNSSTTRDTSTVPPGNVGAYSLRLSGQNAFSLSTTCNRFPVEYKLTPNNFYTFSIFAKASANATLNLNLTANANDVSASVNQVKAITLTTDWARYFVTLYIDDKLSPANDITVAFNMSGTLTGQTVWVDNAQFERGFKPTDYFDGSLPLSTGVFWSGTAHASYSYYYQNRTIKVPRILSTLDDWVPYKTPWRVRTFKGLEGVSYS